MTYTIDHLKQLREETGVSFALCKQALEKSNNDIEKAKIELKKMGVEHAHKKAKREAKQGSFFSYIHHNKKIVATLELLCETDFVANNSDFQALGNDIVQQIASMNPDTKETLLKQPFIKDNSLTIEELIKQAILKIGENIIIGRFERWEI